MEKRFLLAVVLCLLILMFWQSYMSKQQEEWKAKQKVVQSEEESFVPEMQPPSTGETDRTGEEIPGEILTGRLEREAAHAIPSSDKPCKDVLVNTPLYQAIFCSHNGRLMSWKLKEYSVGAPCTCPVVEKFKKSHAPELPESGPETWAEMIRAEAPEHPLGLEISTGNTRVMIHEALEPDRFELDLFKGDAPAQVVFSGTDSQARGIERIYTFSPETYLMNLEIRIQGVENEIQTAGLGLKLTEEISTEKSRYFFSGFMGFIDGKLVKEKKIKEQEILTYSGDVAWEGFSDKYFLNCLIPEDNPKSSVILEQAANGNGNPQGIWVSRLIYNIKNHTQGGTGRFDYSLYVGPKNMDVLKASGHSLQDSIDLGWFGFIAEPLLVVLKFFYRYTHNYGIAIILLTIIIKILFHPLTRKQYESMGEMQKLQPKMQALREKFKGDKERMNKEVMDLYRTNKINPLGGCWPMLLQIPVFFALYKALLNSIELRHAPFMFWIQDLSEKDPCYITPIIMGATMFLQQKMTPMAGDPAQQRMMMFMPLIFTFLFLNFPSGLVLYWLVNNVITIGQQYVSQKRKR